MVHRQGGVHQDAQQQEEGVQEAWQVLDLKPSLRMTLSHLDGIQWLTILLEEAPTMCMIEEMKDIINKKKPQECQTVYHRQHHHQEESHLHSIVDAKELAEKVVFHK